MHTRHLMILSAGFMAIPGIVATFLPHETLNYFGSPVDPISVLLFRITGALYLGFAILNWMARGNLIGGIYSRPLALGNFLHFFMVAMMLLKTVLAQVTYPILIAALAYATFAVWFGLVLFRHPGGQQTGKPGK